MKRPTKALDWLDTLAAPPRGGYTVPTEGEMAAQIIEYIERLEGGSSVNPNHGPWSCGHTGLPSIYPTETGDVECTECANRRGAHLEH